MKLRDLFRIRHEIKGQGLNTYDVPGNIIDTRYTSMSKQTEISALMDLYSSVGRGEVVWE